MLVWVPHTLHTKINHHNGMRLVNQSLKGLLNIFSGFYLAATLHGM